MNTTINIASTNAAVSLGVLDCGSIVASVSVRGHGRLSPPHLFRSCARLGGRRR